MSKQVRVYDFTYSVPVDVVTGTIVNASTPQYFTGYTFLRDKKVKAISVMPVLLNLAAGANIFLTLTNVAGDQKLYNYPIQDLVVTGGGGVNNQRLRLFNVENIELDNSYYLLSTNLSWVVTGRLFILNFHY
jgi:hypothetical protein